MRHGFAGEGLTEERPALPGRCRTSGGLGAMSGPPCWLGRLLHQAGVRKRGKGHPDRRNRGRRRGDDRVCDGDDDR
jgi:hypothetical protein